MNAEELDPILVIELMKKRATLKVLGNAQAPIEISHESAQQNDAIVRRSVETAGWAPFHFNRDINGLAEPWRAHILWHQECRQVAGNFFDWFTDVQPTNKLPSMLSACGALVLVTWIPQFRTKQGQSPKALNEKQIQIDEEHLAASSAMTQNLLLLLTSHGMGTYWSSGGQFRTEGMFEKLGIDTQERLLGAIFVEYPETQALQLERIPGKLREARDTRWIREIQQITP
ncbi:MAG: nitroreductase family protein [Planctomycetota bacterium]